MSMVSTGIWRLLLFGFSIMTRKWERNWIYYLSFPSVLLNGAETGSSDGQEYCACSHVNPYTARRPTHIYELF